MHGTKPAFRTRSVDEATLNMFENRSYQNLIADIPFFSALPEAEVPYLASAMLVRELPAGSVLFREGEVGDRFFVLTHGEVEVIKFLETPDERRLSLLGPGDIFGEMSLFYPDRQRSASARTLTQVQALEMTHADFEILLQRQPDLAFRIMREMTVRLRNTEQVTIRELQERNQQLAQAYQDLKAAQAQLIEQEKNEYELALAHRIQQGILPADIPSFPGWQLTTHWQPAHAVGGDFYDFISFPDGKLGIAIGDATGKGVPAALVMATTCSILRAIAAGLPAGQAISPGEFLRQSNELLCRQVPAGMFVTCLLAVLDPTTGELRYANAGHCLPCQQSEAGVSELRATGMPLGLLPGMTYEEKDTFLAPGDQVILVSDGLVEAHNAERQIFGTRRLLDSLAKRPASVESISYLLDVLERFTLPGTEQEDDLTIVALARLPGE
jgi:serine phosphatase RsbU (regulator of sigma subunit)